MSDVDRDKLRAIRDDENSTNSEKMNAIKLLRDLDRGTQPTGKPIRDMTRDEILADIERVRAELGYA
jgi:hypothetical protein